MGHTFLRHPIGERAREFGIQGMGIEWKHDTMNSQQAQNLARPRVSEQKHSVHNAFGRGVVGVPALRQTDSEWTMCG